MDVGTKLRKLRLEKEFTQEFVANELDVSQPTYNKIESGNGKVTIDKIEKICKLYDVSPDHFFPSHVHVNLGPSSHSNSGVIKNLGDSENLLLIKKLYEELLSVKDQQISMLKAEIEDLKQRLKDV